MDSKKEYAIKIIAESQEPDGTTQKVWLEIGDWQAIFINNNGKPKLLRKYRFRHTLKQYKYLRIPKEMYFQLKNKAQQMFNGIKED